MAIDVVINGALQALDLFTQERHGLDNRTGDQLRRSAQLALFLAVELALQVFGQGFTPGQQRTQLPRMQRRGLPGRRSEEHTSELQSLMRISYAVFCLKKKKTHNSNQNNKNHNAYKPEYTSSRKLKQ